MSKETISINTGLGPTLLQLTFLVLKLCKVIDWSWWLVLLPTIIPCGLVILLLIIAGIVKIIK